MIFLPNKAVNTLGTSIVGMLGMLMPPWTSGGATQLLNTSPSILCPLQVLEIKCWLPKLLYSSLVSDLWSKVSQKKERFPTAPCISFLPYNLHFLLLTYYVRSLEFIYSSQAALSFNSLRCSSFFTTFLYSFLFLRVRSIISAVDLGHPKWSTRYNAF